MQVSWSAQQYVAFEDERTRPIRDLLAAVPPGFGGRAIDLGCGPGNSTEVLSATLPAARVSGIDSSPDMIEAARKRLPQVDFSVADIAAWRDPGPFDVILANASLHWLPDHETLFPALAVRLAPGGALAATILPSPRSGSCARRRYRGLGRPSWPTPLQHARP
jgi:trans-aconitate 2-methyltransferase